MIKEYYNLIKPRMVFMNVLVADAAFVFASPDIINWWNFAFMTAGLSFVVASACVYNNYTDRFMDARMERTRERSLSTGRISPKHALVFGFVLISCGILLLLKVFWLAEVAALFGFAVYVFVYTPLKPKTSYALYAGALAGAMPPVVGYAAAALRIDIYALALFLLLFLWQIPHFLAIARYRYEEYSAAGVPLLVRRPHDEKERYRARRIFYFSLVGIVLLCLTLILQRWIR